MTAEKNYLVEKRNILNEIKKNEMTVQELKLLSMYLAKINPRDIKTRQVRFPVKGFQKLMDLKRANIPQLKATAEQLLQHVVSLDSSEGGFDSFQIFKRCKVRQQDGSTEWYFEIDAHDDALPLMFDYKKDYFKYKLGNVLNLNSTNQVRMYEMLKQFEFVGKRKLALDKLKDLLGIEQRKYARWERLLNRVIKPCQKALLEHTDISFSFEPIRNGRGGKVVGVEFLITGNKNYDAAIDEAAKELMGEQMFEGETESICVEGLNYSEESEQKPEPDKQPYYSSVDYNKDMLFKACKREFTESEMELLVEIASQSPIFSSDQDRELSICEYLSKKHKELCYRDSKNPIKYRFAYFKKLLEVGKVKLEAEEQLKEFETSYKSRRSNYNLERKPSYDIEAYENDNDFSDSLDQDLEKLNVSNVIQFTQV